MINFSSFRDELVKIAVHEEGHKEESKSLSFAKNMGLSTAAGGGVGVGASVASSKALRSVAASRALRNYMARNPKKFAKLMAKLSKFKLGRGVYKGVIKQMVTPAHGKVALTGAALGALVSAIKA